LQRGWEGESSIEILANKIVVRGEEMKKTSWNLSHEASSILGGGGGSSNVKKKINLEEHAGEGKIRGQTWPREGKLSHQKRKRPIQCIEETIRNQPNKPCQKEPTLSKETGIVCRELKLNPETVPHMNRNPTGDRAD